MTALLTILAALSAALHIRAEYAGPVYQIYVFKPLTMLLIILIALLIRRTVSRRYRALVIAGLLFSLGGDIFLMLPVDMFIAGLVSFLLAQVCYTVAFTSDIGFTVSLPLLVPFALYGAVIFGILAPHTGKMKLPVLVYMVVILIMAWQASVRWSLTGESGARLAFLGAVLFVISDSLLALDRFRGKFKAARLLVLTTYFSAQWLIALSLASL